MYVKLNGVISGLDTGDTINKIEIVWKAGSETEAQAITAGRTVTLQSPADDAKIAAFRATGYVQDCGALVSGTVYTVAVRVTENVASGGTAVSGWTDGSTFTYTAVGIPTAFTAVGGTNSAALAWTAPGTGSPIGYNIYRAPDSSGAAGTYAWIGFTASTSYSDSTAVNGTVYWYKVAAVNSYGEGSAITNPKRILPPNLFFDDFTASNGTAIDSTRWLTAGYGTKNASSAMTVQSNACSITLASMSAGNYVATGVTLKDAIAYAANRTFEVTLGIQPPTGCFIDVVITGSNTVWNNSANMPDTNFLIMRHQPNMYVETSSVNASAAWTNILHGPQLTSGSRAVKLVLLSASSLQVFVDGVSAGTATFGIDLGANLKFHVSFLSSVLALNTLTLDTIKIS